MTEIDPQKFGAMQANLKNLSNDMKELVQDVKDGLDKIHTRIDDHMEKEEEEQKSNGRRIAEIEQHFRFVKWIGGILLFLWPLLGPVLQRIIADIFLPSAQLSELLTFLQIDKF